MNTDEEELKKNRFWKSLTGYQKHMTLMYFYRLLTDPDHIVDYIETYRFQKMGVDPFDLPNFVFFMKPSQLKEMALEQPYSPIFVPEVKVYPEFKKSGFKKEEFNERI